MSPDDYNGNYLIVVCTILLIFTYISVALRCFVRIKLTKAFQADDWLIIAAQAVFTVSCACSLRGLHYGMGHHNSVISQDNVIQSMKFQSLALLTYIVNMLLIKWSVCVLLLRLAVSSVYIWILRISIAIVTIMSLGIFFYSVFQCTPVEAQWNFTIKGAKCAGTRKLIYVAYALSTMSITSDWLYALLPIPMIWNINMSLQKKLSVGVILSLGVFASIATIIRISFLRDLTKVQDILFMATNSMIWTLVEPGVAIIAASLVTIRPLLRAFNLAGFDTSRNGSGEENHILSRNQRFKRFDDEEAGKGGSILRSDASSILTQDDDVHVRMEIQRTVDVTINYSRPRARSDA